MSIKKAYMYDTKKNFLTISRSMGGPKVVFSMFLKPVQSLIDVIDDPEV